MVSEHVFFNAVKLKKNQMFKPGIKKHVLLICSRVNKHTKYSVIGVYNIFDLSTIDHF